MAVDRDIDFTGFDSLFAETIIREMGGERARAVFLDLQRQGATKAQVLARFRKMLPSWAATADRVAVVFDYLAGGGGEE